MKKLFSLISAGALIVSSGCGTLGNGKLDLPEISSEAYTLGAQALEIYMAANPDKKASLEGVAAAMALLHIAQQSSGEELKLVLGEELQRRVAAAIRGNGHALHNEDLAVSLMYEVTDPLFKQEITKDRDPEELRTVLIMFAEGMLSGGK